MLGAFVGGARVLVVSEVAGVEVFEIAHEALLREWATLVDWLDADREALRLRQELARYSREFAKQHDPEFLWGKGRIEEAERLLGMSTVELNDDEQMLLDQSKRVVRARERSVRLGRIMWMSALALVAVVAVVTALRLTKKDSLLRDELSVQKGLRASMISKDKSWGSEPLFLAIEAVGPYGSDFDPPPPPEAYQGMMAALNRRGGLFATLDCHSATIRHLEFSPDGSLLVTWATNKSAHTACLWNIDSGKDLVKLDNQFTLWSFSPDGSRLATGGGLDRTARLWDVNSGKELAKFDSHTGLVTALAFSSDGSLLATGSRGARLWDVDSRMEIASFAGHTDSISELAFSPDGSRLATSSRGATYLWNVDNDKEIARLDGHSNLAFSVPQKNLWANSGSGSLPSLW